MGNQLHVESHIVRGSGSITTAEHYDFAFVATKTKDDFDIVIESVVRRDDRMLHRVAPDDDTLTAITAYVRQSLRDRALGPSWAHLDDIRESNARYHAIVTGDAEQIATEDLLAAILGAGFSSPHKPSKSVALRLVGDAILSHVGGLQGLRDRDLWARLLGVPGVGLASASRIACAIQLGLRVAAAPKKRGRPRTRGGDHR